MDYEKIAKKFHLRFKFDILRKYYGEKDKFTVLDVGAGNHSASIFKTYYPNSYYVGLDKERDYVQNQQDFASMDEFILIDLVREEVKQKITKRKFDLIIMSHIIEHLPNGDKLICNLFEYLKENGRIYIEWPSERAVLLPKSKYPTLNFYDDDTHVKIYPLYEICNVLCNRGGVFCEGGIRRHRKEIFLMPILALISVAKRGRVSGSVFWDIKGFSNYVVFKREISCYKRVDL